MKISRKFKETREKFSFFTINIFNALLKNLKYIIFYGKVLNVVEKRYLKKLKVF